MFGYTLVKTSEIERRIADVRRLGEERVAIVEKVVCKVAGERDAALAKIDRMTGGLRQNRRSAGEKGEV